MFKKFGMMLNLTVIIGVIKINLGLLAEASNILKSNSLLDISLFVFMLFINTWLGSSFLSDVVNDLKKEFKIEEKLHS